jgi:hypothetical protein
MLRERKYEGHGRQEKGRKKGGAEGNQVHLLIEDKRGTTLLLNTALTPFQFLEPAEVHN